MISITDQNGHNQHWHFNQYNQIDSYTDKAGRTATYGYDGNGRLSQRVDRNGKLTTYGRDESGRLTSLTFPGDTVNVTYDAFGNVATVANGASTLGLSYDDTQQVSRITTGPGPGPGPGAPLPSSQLTVATDGIGNVTSLTGPGSSTSYHYDAKGRLDQVGDTVAGHFSYGWDGLNRLASVSRPNGVNDTITYDTADEMLSRDAARNGQLINPQRYTYDSSGRRITATDISGTHDYSYDAVGRLTDATHPAAANIPNESYGYDPEGSRTSWAANPTPTVTYDGADRLTGDNNNTYKYDFEGNLVSKTARSTGLQTTYDWNVRHQLLAVHNPDGSSTAYQYNGIGQRVEVNNSGQITRFGYDASGNVRTTYDGTGGVTATYVTSPGSGELLGVTMGTSVSYPLVDAVGTTKATTDAAGAVTSRTAVDTFGRLSDGSPPSPKPHTFAGLTGDPNGLYYANARYYDPATGRFLSEDPVLSRNLYAYASNDPVSRTDPSGRDDAVEEGEGLIPQEESEEAERCAGQATMARLIIAGLPLLVYDASGSLGPSAAGIQEAIDQGAPTILKRVTDKSTIRSNRRGACKGFDCALGSPDEFPFASTAQGGAGAHITPISIGEQRIQGGTLSSFYQRCGVEDGDWFRIVVTGLE